MRLAGVRKSYPVRGEVLRGVDLELAEGRPVGVVGGNGTGKSTLLRIVAGVASPSAGRVRGRPGRIGYQPQAAPPARLSVLSYLRHHAAMHGVGGAGRAREALELLDELEFSADRGGRLAALSSGNLQKVVLAQAIGCAAGLIVLDEPWTALDAAAVGALERRLGAEATAGRLLLIADHSGRAGRLPGAHTVRVADGLLADVPRDEPAVEAWSTVVLRCPVDPAQTLAALPAVTRSWQEDGLLGVRLPAAGGDALLAAALGLGCSVITVRRG
ncbi:MAG TPA: ATP-binding cassette domain-containing protein [Pseudonocardia sp.]